MDASTLAKELDKLENSLPGLDSWLNFWTMVVVLGVALELIVLVVEYKHDRRNFIQKSTRTSEKPSLLVYGLGFAGAALVALGVAGEFRIHIVAGAIEDKMRGDTRQFVSIVQRDAAQADERARRVESANTVLKQQLKTEGEKAREQEAKLTRDNLETKQHLENEAQKRVAVEQQLAWRSLTKEQESRLMSPISTEIAGTKLIVANVMGDAEGRAFAGELWDALRKAGWGDVENPALKGTQVGNPRALFFSAAVPEGLEIIERGKPDAGNLLYNTLSGCGIEVSMLLIPESASDFNLSSGPMSSGMAAMLNATIPVNTVELLIGVKPRKGR